MKVDGVASKFNQHKSGGLARQVVCNAISNTRQVIETWHGEGAG